MVFDAHSDIFTDVVLRRLKGETEILKKYHLERLRAGNIEGSCFVFWIDPPFDRENPELRLNQLLQTAKDELAECDEVVVVRNTKELERAKAEGKFYIVLGLEGMSGLGEDVERLYELHDFGFRHGMLTWNEQNALATGVRGDDNRGLTPLGKKAISIMEEKKMIVDVSHLNEKSFYDVVSFATTPLFASHSNAYSLASAKRNLKDEQLLAMRDAKGLIGLNAFNLFIHDEPKEQTVDNFIKQAAYIAEKIGVEHLCFGFDFFEFLDSTTIGGFSTEPSPCAVGLEDCTKVPMLLQKMKSFGFLEKEIEGIAHKNWYDFMKKTID
ncbi:MAG: membrane dipeptidase [Bacillota bacterium]